jgi:hypothetical protein
MENKITKWAKKNEPSALLSEAKFFLQENYENGCECPACGQYAKKYTRKITSSMAYGLILLVKSNKTDFFHVEDFLKLQNCPSSIRGDISKLRYFGLLEKLELIREDGSNRAGYYKVTQKAIQFVNNLTTVPESCFIYNDTLLGFSENHVNIVGALSNKFNYNELMS